jgi:hypothetical protein
MTFTDYIPHGMILTLGGIVSYVFKEHTKQDDARFGEIRDDLKTLVDGQTVTAKNIADNHAEVLRLFITAGQVAATNEALSKSRDLRV